MIDAVSRQDYEWLAETSSQDAFQQLLNLHCQVSNTYRAELGRGSWYERFYYIHLNNGTTLSLKLSGGYYDPLDNPPPEQELLETMKLEHVSCTSK